MDMPDSEVCTLEQERLEHSERGKVDAPKSVDLYILEQEVGAQWKSACGCTRGVYMGECWSRRPGHSKRGQVDVPECVDV